MPAIPVVYFILRILTKYSVAKAVKRGIWDAAGQATARITSMFVSNAVIMSLNVFLIVLATYVSSDLSDTGLGIIIVTSVYASSVMYTMYSVIINIPTLIRITLKHKLNVVGYIEDEIYSAAYDEARSDIDGLGVFKGTLNKLWGNSAHEIARSVASSAIGVVVENILIKSIWFLVAFTVYISVFRMYVAPILIDDATGLSLVQAFLWPFAFSVDFYFNTGFLSYVMN